MGDHPDVDADRSCVTSGDCRHLRRRITIEEGWRPADPLNRLWVYDFRATWCQPEATPLHIRCLIPPDGGYVGRDGAGYPRSQGAVPMMNCGQTKFLAGRRTGGRLVDSCIGMGRPKRGQPKSPVCLSSGRDKPQWRTAHGRYSSIS